MHETQWPGRVPPSPLANTTLLVGDLLLSQEAGPHTYADEKNNFLGENKLAYFLKFRGIRRSSIGLIVHDLSSATQPEENNRITVY